MNVRFGSKADMTANPPNVRFTPKSGHSAARSRCPALCQKQTLPLIRTTDYPCRAVFFCLVLSSSLAKPHPLANPNFFDCHDPADQPIPNARRPGLGWPRQWPRITAYSDGRGRSEGTWRAAHARPSFSCTRNGQCLRGVPSYAKGECGSGNWR
jgi:hypothetical protein